jgi:topoisomerase-4 subunit A
VARGRGVIIMGLENGEKLVDATVFDGKAIAVAGTGRGGKQKEIVLSGERLKHHFGRRARMGRVLPDKLKPTAIPFSSAIRREQG